MPRPEGSGDKKTVQKWVDRGWKAATAIEGSWSLQIEYNKELEDVTVLGQVFSTETGGKLVCCDRPSFEIQANSDGCIVTFADKLDEDITMVYKIEEGGDTDEELRVVIL